MQQDISLAVIRNIARLKTTEAFTVWLYRIARSKAIRYLYAHPGDVPLDEEPLAVTDLPDDETFDAADAARVHSALDKLKPEHRDVLLLRFMESLSYEEIAEVVECGVGTVRSRIHYAKCALRRQLEK